MKKKWESIIDGRDMDNGEIISAICEARGIDDLTEFLNPNEECLIPYDKFINIDRAREIVENGIDDNLNFCILSDVDTDGVCSGAIIYKYLSHFTNNITIDINEGKVHGVEDLETSADILIVVDSINAADDYKKFTDKGTKVVVLDHHIPPSFIEEYSHVTLVSSAVDYPNPQLSGSGVTWKFCKYLDEYFLTDYADELVDLAATGIIADMCDVSVAENRYICYEGLNNLHNLGLKKIVGSYQFNSQSVSFSVAPLVNACTRLNRNQLPLNLLLCDNETKVKQIIKEMKTVKDQQNEIVDELMIRLAPEAELQTNRKMMTFIIDNEEGIAGLVANKIMSMYQRPVIVLKQVDDEYKGSMRACGMADFSYEVNMTGLATCEGHENAAGIFIPQKNFDRFLETIENRLADVEFEERIFADVKLNIEQINTQLINSFKAINFISGTGFKPLTVMVNGISGYTIGDMSKGKHLKLSLGDTLIIKWGYTGNFDEFENAECNVIAELNNGYFGKTFYNQLIIQDYRVGESE